MNKERLKVRAAARVALDEILPEYDFSRARPNKYAARYASARMPLKPKTELEESDLLYAEAIFTLGFKDKEARHAFITEVDT